MFIEKLFWFEGGISCLTSIGFVDNRIVFEGVVFGRKRDPCPKAISKNNMGRINTEFCRYISDQTIKVSGGGGGGSSSHENVDVNGIAKRVNLPCRRKVTIYDKRGQLLSISTIVVRYVPYDGQITLADKWKTDPGEIHHKQIIGIFRVREK